MSKRINIHFKNVASVLKSSVPDDKSIHDIIIRLKNSDNFVSFPLFDCAETEEDEKYIINKDAISYIDFDANKRVVGKTLLKG